MKFQKSIALLLALAALFCFPVTASAAETTEANVPVVLTVINTVKPISVTVPASLPVSMVDGYLVTASNAKITNNREEGAIAVKKVEIQAGSFRIGSYENFAAEKDSIALNINGCPTEKEGPLKLSKEGFPAIEAGESLPIQYRAKVASASTVTNINAATVVFTIEAVEGGTE